MFGREILFKCMQQSHWPTTNRVTIIRLNTPVCPMVTLETEIEIVLAETSVYNIQPMRVTLLCQ